MQILKYLFLLLFLAFIGVTVYVATQKGDFKVSTSKVLRVNKISVFEYANDFKNWESFGSWIKKNDEIKFNYPEKTIGLGAYCSWESSSNDGTIKTVFVKENDSIAQKIKFNGTLASISWKFKDTIGGTKVTVFTEGKMDLFTKISTFFHGGISTVLSDVYEKSLVNLDKTLNYEMKTYAIKVNGVVQRNSGFCLQQTVSCKMKSVSKNIKIMMTRMVHFFNKNKLPMAGKPFVLYNRYDVPNDFVTLSVCVPTQKQIFVSPESDLVSGEIIPFTCLKTTLVGDYSHTQEAWSKAKKYIADKGFKENYAGSYSEVYVKTIDDIKKPSKWITEIYIPIFPKVETVQSTVEPIPTENNTVETP